MHPYPHSRVNRFESDEMIPRGFIFKVSFESVVNSFKTEQYFSSIDSARKFYNEIQPQSNPVILEYRGGWWFEQKADHAR